MKRAQMKRMIGIHNEICKYVDYRINLYSLLIFFFLERKPSEVIFETKLI